jgi:hypothetical protein
MWKTSLEEFSTNEPYFKSQILESRTWRPDMYRDVRSVFWTDVEAGTAAPGIYSRVAAFVSRGWTLRAPQTSPRQHSFTTMRYAKSLL